MLGCRAQSPAAQMLGSEVRQILVHEDAVVALEPGVARERVRGHDADGDEHEVRGDLAAVGQPHRRHALLARLPGAASVPAQRRPHDESHARAAHDLHAVPRVLGLVELRHHGRHDAIHHAVGAPRAP